MLAFAVITRIVRSLRDLIFLGIAVEDRTIKAAVSGLSSAVFCYKSKRKRISPPRAPSRGLMQVLLQQFSHITRLEYTSYGSCKHTS